MYQYVRQARGLDLFHMPYIDIERASAGNEFQTESETLLKKQPLNDKHNHQMKDIAIIDDWD